ncbi:leucine-rich repeat domain-containing protein [Nannocystis punicea]|uniref:Leucine-rich repeat domain-containing protein n=1 Tax=Nannocystis punicea TaxID=2995304 RepID=A0ABY7HBM4_9BACT|nr:hypothetical protein [Nannocystis poenicansa]WAS96512.1 hypothetical protein O0S08_10175 [Nannocystis poenicansa]
MILSKRKPAAAVLASTWLSACVLDYKVGDSPQATSTTDATTATTPGMEPTSSESASGEPEETSTTSGTTDQLELTSTTTPEPVDCSEIVLADEVLLQAVRDALGIAEGPISPAAALELEMLVVDGGVASIAGLECFSNLEDLTLNNTTVDDFSPLAGLARLWRLDLANNGLTELDTLTGLPMLNLLELHDNAIVDLQPVAALPGLTYLYADRNAIVDLGPLAGASALFDLSLRDNQITSLSALGSHPQLTYLAVDDNPLAEGLEVLSGAPKLFAISAANTGLTELPAVPPPSLGMLTLPNNHISDLSPLQNYPALEFTFALGNNQITTLAPFMDAPCAVSNTLLSVTGNPLDANSLDTLIPALCDLGLWMFWDGGEC